MITTNIMYLNTSVEMHEKVAALTCGALHTIEITFSKNTVFKNKIYFKGSSTICLKRAKKFSVLNIFGL